MNARTHVLGGLAAAGVAISLGVPHPVVVAAASAFGGLIPDWDHPHSTIGRWIPWPSVSRSRGDHLPPDVGRRGWPHAIWHRHQAHSLVGSALASAVGVGLVVLVGHLIARVLAVSMTSGLIEWLGIGLFLGCLSHLALDAFNQTPQWWLWPFSRQGFRWPLHAPVKRIDGVASLILVVVVAFLGWHIAVTHALPIASGRRFWP